MKNSIKISLIFGILIISILGASFFTNTIEKTFDDAERKNEVSQKIYPKTSAIVSPIFIDDIGVNDWIWASSQSWCSGSGTISDPYVLENLIIDASYSTTCISIQNSNKFFTIQNCTLIKSSTAFSMSSIRLINGVNGKILNNNLSLCGAGVYLEDCNEIRISRNIIGFNYYGIWFENTNMNIRIEGNHIYNNSFDGINMDNAISSPYNIISNNVIENNNFDGIVGTDCYYTTISGNQINNNGEYGVYFSQSDSNDILDNEINDNEADGISLSNSISNTISDNSIYRNGIGIGSSCGGIVLLGDSDFTVITNNIVNENNHTGIRTSPSTDFCFISGNIVSENIRTAIVTNGNFETITNNRVNDNGDYGIMCNNGDYNYIDNNIVERQGIRGIRIKSNDYTTISDNIVKKTDYGISTYESNYATIIGNTVSDCVWRGISLDDWSYYITITENKIFDGYIGIRMSSEADYNNIYYNCMKKNSEYNALDYGYMNYWDMNYYDDYSGEDLNGDGFGDIEYNITSNSKDYRPLMRCPFEEPKRLIPLIPPSDDDDDEKEDEKEDFTWIWIVAIISAVTVGSIGIGYYFIRRKKARTKRRNIKSKIGFAEKNK